MLSITDLPLLALAFPAAATFVCSALGRTGPPRPGFWARWVVRLALLLSLATVVTILFLLQPGGTLQTTLWRLDPRLPVTFEVDTGGTVIAVMVLVAALVVSFAARERRPLASAALGLAVVGGLTAAFAGDLLCLYIGLQLSALGGIGLSYARQPRVASTRMVWAAIADQSVGLIWLGTMVVLLRQTSTLELAAIPPSVVGPAVAGLLLLPAVVRLVGCALIAGSPSRRPGQVARAVDVSDWLTVVAIPTALLVMIRVQALSGGKWPTPWFGTCLDLLAMLLGAAAVGLLLYSTDARAEIRALLLAATALVVVGFGQNSADGTLLGLGAGLFLELSAAYLPRALLSRPHRRASQSPQGGAAWGRAQLLLSGATSLLPLSLGFGVGLLGLSLALAAGLGSGFAPALAYIFALAGLVLAMPRLWRLLSVRPRWTWPLSLPAICLLAAALLPGWTITVAAASLATPGTAAASLLSAPDPLVVLAPGLLWPGGYLSLLVAVITVGAWAVRVASGAGPAAAAEAAPAADRNETKPPPPVAALLGWGSAAPRVATEVRGWYLILVNLADREVGERPVWLWLAATAAAAWLLTEWVRL